MGEKIYTIKDLSKITEIKITTIRKYEVDFDLKIPRNEMGHRVYSESEVQIYRKIKAMKERGAGTELIREIIVKSADVMEQKEKAMELITIDRLTGAELKEVMLSQIADILQERDKMYLDRIEKLEKKMEHELESQREKICDQMKSENEKLIKYIAISREEESKKDSFWERIFGRSKKG